MFRVPAGVCLLALLPLLVAGEPTNPYLLLKMRRFRLAVEEFTALQAARPGVPSVEIGLGRALAGVGRCDAAVAQLAPYRSTAAWNARAAITEGDCWQRLGNPAAAAEAYADAVTLNPTSKGAWLALGLVAIELDDGAAVGMAVDGLGGDGAFPLVLRAWWELHHGAPGFELTLAELARAVDPAEPGPDLYLALLEALASLDADDATHAEVVLQRARETRRGHQRLAAWQAEAMRRDGRPGSAQALLDETALRGDETELRAAIGARVLADLGDLAGARAMVADLGVGDVEVAATRWYLAAPGEREALARAWERFPHPEWRTLAQLVPVTEGS